MATTLEIDKLSRVEKLQALEAIWESLTLEDEVESPEWHRRVLAETEARVAEGSEDILEWGEAKKMLRERFV